MTLLTAIQGHSLHYEYIENYFVFSYVAIVWTCIQETNTIRYGDVIQALRQGEPPLNFFKIILVAICGKFHKFVSTSKFLEFFGLPSMF